MKKLLTPLLLVTLVLQGYSQSALTLTQSNVLIPTDTVYLNDVTGLIGSAPTFGTNATWNYTTVTGGTPVSYNYIVLSNDPDFPTAQFKRTNYIKGLTPAVGFYFDQYFEINASGVQAIGMRIPAQQFGLGPFTGNSADSIFILGNVITYSAPRNMVAFPATAGSSWASTVRCVANMELSVASASLNHAPLEEAFYFTRMDTVNGWGTLQEPPVSGYMSDLPVLAVKSAEYCVDSFYLNGSPAPSAVTTPFGITQGQVSGPENYREYLYTVGQFGYQMLYNYTDNTFGSLYSTGGAYMNKSLPVATGISTIDALQLQSGVYPNPVTGTQFSIRSANTADAAEIRLYDLSGRLVQAVQPATYDGRIGVTLTSSLADGMYTYTVSNKEGKIIDHGRFTSAK
ncbi:MAG: T9SS type A sorting domain-containing protein [Bacteroidetes bacterium]|nr:T9SS type A sorting domain-containing protein [Bacteroidota bacterium]